MNIHSCTILAGLVLASSLSAQSTEIPAAPQDRPVIIGNAVVHAVSDEHPEPFTGWVRFENGLITGVGEGEMPADIPNGFEIIDVEGLHLVPGFVALNTQLGLVETLQVDATDDRSEYGSRTPEVAPWVSVNPDSDLIPVARSAGILHTLLVPTGGTIPGRSSLIRLDGWTTEDLVVMRDAGLIISWPLAARAWPLPVT